MRKNSKEDERTWEELNSVHRHLQSKCQFVQTGYIKRVNLFWFNFCHIINILLTELSLSRFVWENRDLVRVNRPHRVRSVLTTSVKILPYRPPARLIRAK